MGRIAPPEIFNPPNLKPSKPELLGADGALMGVFLHPETGPFGSPVDVECHHITEITNHG